MPYAHKAVDELKRVASVVEEVVRDREKLLHENAALQCLIEELANEFMIVGNDPANPLPAYMGKDDLYHYLANERLAGKVNKALGLVK